jgi:UDP-glucuronate decarboxylase
MEDMIRAFIAFMDSPAEVTGPINLGNPVEFTIGELAERVLALTQSKSRIDYRPLPADDPVQRRPDITRANTLLGWSPRIQLDEGLTHTVEYFRQVIETAS